MEAKHILQKVVCVCVCLFCGVVNIQHIDFKVYIERCKHITVTRNIRITITRAHAYTSHTQTRILTHA